MVIASIYWKLKNPSVLYIFDSMVIDSNKMILFENLNDSNYVEMNELINSAFIIMFFKLKICWLSKILWIMLEFVNVQLIIEKLSMTKFII